MRALLIIILFCTFLNCQAQTDYSQGFTIGYKYGYCHDEANCIPPTTPVTPTPRTGENYNSYTDGYNRGFQMGLDAKRASGNNNSSSGLITNAPKYRPPVSESTLVAGYQYKEQVTQQRIKRFNEDMNTIQSYISVLEKCGGYPNTINLLREAFQELLKVQVNQLNNDSSYNSVVKYLNEVFSKVQVQINECANN